LSICTSKWRYGDFSSEQDRGLVTHVVPAGGLVPAVTMLVVPGLDENLPFLLTLQKLPKGIDFTVVG